MNKTQQETIGIKHTRTQFDSKTPAAAILTLILHQGKRYMELIV